MSELLDLTGQTYNKWTVIKRGHSKQTPKGQTKTYWNCKCSCGKIKDVYMDSLKSGKSKSCGCTKGREQGDAAKHMAYNLYKTGAKGRSLEFNITENDFIKLTSQNCYYCDSKPSNRSGSIKNKGFYNYNGLDRVNNDIGYNVDNIVPCCKNCNLAKRQLTQTEFFDLIKKVYERHIK